MLTHPASTLTAWQINRQAGRAFEDACLRAAASPDLQGFKRDPAAVAMPRLVPDIAFEAGGRLGQYTIQSRWHITHDFRQFEHCGWRIVRFLIL